MAIRLKRAYEPPAPTDGYRVLVDRLWPRGVRKDVARIDLWAKDIAPTSDLRRWFGHDPARFSAFTTRYRQELARVPARAVLDTLARRAAHGMITLVYGARDQKHNGAVVLKEEIEGALGSHAARPSC